MMRLECKENEFRRVCPEGPVSLTHSVLLVSAISIRIRIRGKYDLVMIPNPITGFPPKRLLLEGG